MSKKRKLKKLIKRRQKFYDAVNSVDAEHIHMLIRLEWATHLVDLDMQIAELEQQIAET